MYQLSTFLRLRRSITFQTKPSRFKIEVDPWIVISPIYIVKFLVSPCITAYGVVMDLEIFENVRTYDILGVGCLNKESIS